jgi:hypothetical protein
MFGRIRAFYDGYLRTVDRFLEFSERYAVVFYPIIVFLVFTSVFCLPLIDALWAGKKWNDTILIRDKSGTHVQTVWQAAITPIIVLALIILVPIFMIGYDRRQTARYNGQRAQYRPTGKRFKSRRSRRFRD